MQEVKEFKYLGTELCKHGEMDGEIRERAVKGRSVIRSHASVMKGRNVSMEVERFKEKYSPANTDVWIRDLEVK